MVQKVTVKCEFETGLRMRQLENSFCQSSSKWVPFSNWERIRQGKERDGLFSSAVSKIQLDTNPHCPTAIRLWETFTFYHVF